MKLLIPILLIGLALINSTQVQQFTVEGNSMEPSISTGDTVLAKKIDIEDIKIGDTIIIGKIIHNVVEINDKEIITQGTNPSRFVFDGVEYVQQEKHNGGTIYRYVRKNG